MDKLLKRSLTLLLAFVMVFTMMPMTTFAVTWDVDCDEKYPWDGEALTFGAFPDADFIVTCDDIEYVTATWYNRSDGTKLKEAPSEIGNYYVEFDCIGKATIVKDFDIVSGIRIVVSSGSDHPESIVGDTQPIAIGPTEKDEHNDTNDIIYTVNATETVDHVKVVWRDHNGTVINSVPTDLNKYYVTVTAYGDKDETNVVATATKMFYIKNATVIDFATVSDFVYDTTEISALESYDLGLFVTNYEQRKNEIEYYWYDNDGELISTNPNKGPFEAGSYSLKVVAPESKAGDDMYVRAEATKYFNIVEATPIIKLNSTDSVYSGKVKKLSDVDYDIVIARRSGGTTSVKAALKKNTTYQFFKVDGVTKYDQPKYQGAYTVRLGVTKHDNFKAVLIEDAEPLEYNITTATTTITAKDDDGVTLTKSNLYIPATFANIPTGEMNYLNLVSNHFGTLNTVSFSDVYAPEYNIYPASYSNIKYSLIVNINGVDASEGDWTYGIPAESTYYVRTNSDDGGYKWKELASWRAVTASDTSVYAVKYVVPTRVYTGSDGYASGSNYGSDTAFYVFKLSRADGYINFVSTKTEREYNGTAAKPGTFIKVGTASDCDIQYEYDTNMTGQHIYYYKKWNASTGNWSTMWSHFEFPGRPSMAGKYLIGVEITTDSNFVAEGKVFEKEFTIKKNTTVEKIDVHVDETIAWDGAPVKVGTTSDCDVKYFATCGNSETRDVQVQWFRSDKVTTMSNAPTAVGKYYVQLTLPEGKNYAGYKTNFIEVKIVNANATVAASNTNVIYNAKPVVITKSNFATSTSNYVTFDYDGDGAISDIKFYANAEDVNTKNTISTPVNAGTYWVKVSMAPGEHSAATDETFAFTIAKAQPTIDFITPANDGDVIIYTGNNIVAGIETSGDDIIYSFTGYDNKEYSTSGIGDVTVEYAQKGSGLTYGAYQNNTNITQTGTYKVRISVAESANYLASNEIEREFVVKYDEEIIVSPKTIIYDANNVNIDDDFNISINLVNRDKSYKADIKDLKYNDLKVTWLDKNGASFSGTPKDAGEYKLKLELATTSDYLYTSTTTDFVIEKRAVGVTLYNGSSRIYDGTTVVDGVCATFSNMAGSEVFATPSDYTIGVANTTSSNVGTYSYTATVTLATNGSLSKNYCFSGTLGTYVYATTSNSTDTMTINAKPLAESYFAESGTAFNTITLSNPELIYDGTDRTFTTTASDMTGRITTNNIITSNDYTVNYYAGLVATGTDITNRVVNAGKYTIAITGKGNYTGKLVRQFEIQKLEAQLIWGNLSPIYNKDYQKPVATVSNLKYNELEQKTDECAVTVDGQKLNASTGYTATASSLANSNYKLPTVNTKAFEIQKKDVNEISVSLSPASQTYNAGEILNPTVTVEFGDHALVRGTEYTIEYWNSDHTVSYSNLINENDYKVWVIGVGNYTGTKALDYKITHKVYNGGSAGAAGGGGGAYTVITLKEVPHGKFTVDKTQVMLGGTLTITAIPDEGYEVGTLTLNGSVVKGTTNADGTVTYVVKKATLNTAVGGTFVEKKAEENPAEETPVVTYTDENAKTAAAAAVIKARSVRTAKGVKVTIVGDENLDELLANGYTVEYKFYKSTKAKSGYAYKLTKKTNVYTNTTDLKVGTRYYFKARLVVKDASGEVVYTTPLKQCKYATRVIK